MFTNLFVFQKAGIQNNINIDPKFKLLFFFLGFKAAVLNCILQSYWGFSANQLYSSFFIVVIQTYDLAA